MFLLLLKVDSPAAMSTYMDPTALEVADDGASLAPTISTMETALSEVVLTNREKLFDTAFQEFKRCFAVHWHSV